MWASLLKLINRLLDYLDNYKHKERVRKQEADIEKIKENPRDFFNQGNNSNRDDSET